MPHPQFHHQSLQSVDVMSSQFSLPMVESSQIKDTSQFKQDKHNHK